MKHDLLGKIKCYLKFKFKNPGISNTVLKKIMVGRFTLFDFRIYFKAAVVKTLLCGCVAEKIGQWNRMESHDINKHGCR